MKQKLDHNAFPLHGNLSSQMMFLLHYAVRAPSTHNTQPWLFRISENTIELFLDPSRVLKEADVDGRCAMISLGACFEHLLVSARFFNMYTSHEILDPISAREPVARVTLIQGTKEFKAELLPLIIGIEKRFNARGQFENNELTPDLQEGIMGLSQENGLFIDIFTKGKKVEYAQLVVRGMRQIHHSKSFRRELARWIRTNFSDQKDGIPGYTMLAPGPLSLILPSMIRFFDLGKILSILNKKSILSSTAAIVLSSKEDTPLQQFQIGMLFERISLFLSTKNMYTSVYVAAIEIPELRNELRSQLTRKDISPQFAFTIGVPKILFTPTPRLSPEERMI